MNRQAQAVVLLLVGGAILRTSFTDMYLRYVKSGLRPFLILAGVLLVATAVMTLWYELRGGGFSEKREPGGAADGGAAGVAGTPAVDAPAEVSATVAPDDGHGHSHEPRVAWLLVLPVFALLLVAPPALGSYAASRAGTALQEVSDFPPLPEGDPAKISVLDYASRAVFDQGRSIGDRSVLLTGFVLVGRDGRPYLARMIIACCAGDARPIKVGLSGDAPDGLAPDTWIEVTGRYVDRSDTDEVNGETIPYLEVIEWREVPAPVQQYEI